MSKLTQEEIAAKAAAAQAAINSIIGKKFGKLKVLEFAGYTEDKHKLFKVECDCGSVVIVNLANLMNGHTTSCGCNHHEDLTGRKFNHLTVLSYAGSRRRKAFWLVRCDCGNEKEVSAYDLTHGRIKSCGCLRKRKRMNLIDTTANIGEIISPPEIINPEELAKQAAMAAAKKVGKDLFIYRDEKKHFLLLPKIVKLKII